MNEILACAFVATFHALPVALILRVVCRRVPWLVVGLVGGFAIGFVIDPGVNSWGVWAREPWRYYVAIWGPIAGVAAGAVVDVALQLFRRRRIRCKSNVKKSA